MNKLLLAIIFCSTVLFGQNRYFDTNLTVEGAMNHCGADTGSVNAYVCTNPSGATIGAYRDGNFYSFRATHTNTGSSTLAIDGLSAIAIKKLGGSTNLGSGDILTNSEIVVRYNSNSGFFELQSPTANNNLINPSLGNTPLTVTRTVGANTVNANTLVSYTSGALSTSGLGSCGMGVALNTATTGNPAEVAVYGTVQLLADNTVTQNDLIVAPTTTAGYGRDSGFTASSSINAGTCIVGKAITSASTGNLFTVQLHGIGAVGTNPSVSGFTTVALTQPSAPTVTPTCTGTCATTYTYSVVALSPGGTYHTQASTTASTSAQASTLDSSHYNTVVSSLVTNSTSCDVYRTVGGATQGKIGNVLCGASLVDNGLTGDSSTAPTTNTSGNAIIAGNILDQSGLIASSSNSSIAGIFNTLLSGTCVLEAYWGNSTAWNPITWYTNRYLHMLPYSTLGNGCYRSDITTVSVDGSQNVTVNFTNPITAGIDAVVGQFFSLSPVSGTTACAGSGVVSAIGANSVTFQMANSGSCISISSTSTTGYASRWLLNFGNNGSTLTSMLTNTSTTSTGIGGICAVKPTLLTFREGLINDVRLGATTQTQANTLELSAIQSVRACSPSTMILLKGENPINVYTTTSQFSPVSTTETLVDGVANGITGAGIHTVTLATMPSSIYVANNATELPGQVIINTGQGDVETVTVTAVSGNTFTATFASTHSQGFTVIATTASTAQAYSKILRNAVLSLVGKFPNLIVIDQQAEIFGTSAAFQGSPYYASGDALHPNGPGQTVEEQHDQQIFQRLANLPNAQTTTIDPTSSQVRPFYPFLAYYARQSNYSTPGTYYVDYCLDPKYYQLISWGVASAVNSGSAYFQFSPFFSGTGTAAPIQSGDIWWEQSIGCQAQLQNGTTAALVGSATRVSFGNSVTSPNTTIANEMIAVYRPIYPANQTCESYVNNLLTYPYRRRVVIAGGGTNFIRIGFLSNEQLNASVSGITSSDLLCLSNGVQSLSGASFGANGTNLQANITGSFASYAGLFGYVFGNHPYEGQTAITGEVKINPTITTLSGTSGSTTCSMAMQGTLKIATCYLNAYAQTGSAQTYSYPTAFSTVPILQTSGGSCGTYNPTTTASVLTLPANGAMTAETCNVVLIGQ